MPEKRKISLKTIVARIIVFVLFGMLIVSFAIWGIGDIFRRGGRLQAVAEVGPVHIMPQEFQEQYRRELRRLQTILQSELDAQRARELGLPQRVIQDMVGRALLDLAARDAGVAIGDQTVRQTITDNPAFRNAQGQFDRGIFQNALFNANLTEDRFVALIRQDVARGQVTEAIVAGGEVPTTLVDNLYRFRGERRTAETVLIAADSIKSLPEPTDAELETYHREHAANFTAPEYRAITTVEVKPADLASDIKVSDERLQAEYEARIGEFRIPEERILRQILVPDEATIKRAAEALAGGAGFDKVAQEVTGKPPLELGAVKQADVASPELAQAAFDAGEGGVTEPVATPLGWHIVQVVKVTPGRTEPLEAIKDRLSHDVALREAAESVFDVGNKLQDALGGGASLEDAAKKLNLKVVKLDAVDSQGMGVDGKPVTDLPKSPKLLSTAFSSEVGRETDLVDDGQGGYFMLKVEKVMPSQLKPLAEVRDKVLAGWQAEARRKAAEQVAATLIEKLRAGGDLGQLAKSGGYAFATTKAFTRTGEGAAAPLPPEIVAALFEAKTGEFAMSPAPQGAMMARLVSVVPADAKTDEAGVKRLSEQLLGVIEGDLLNAFAGALRAQYGVQINEGVIDSLTGS